MERQDSHPGNVLGQVCNSNGKFKDSEREEVDASWRRPGLLLPAVLLPPGLLGMLNVHNLIKPQHPHEGCSYFPPFHR